MASILTTWIHSNFHNTHTFLIASLASLLLYLLTTTLLAHHRLRHIPDPPLAALINLWSSFTVASGHNHLHIAAAQQKHGQIMRIGPNAVMVYDPDTLWRISAARSAYAHSGWYASFRFHPGGESVFSEVDTVRHDERKARLVRGFAGTSRGMDVEADVVEMVGALVRYIREKHATGSGGDAERLDFGKVIR